MRLLINVGTKVDYKQKEPRVVKPSMHDDRHLLADGYAGLRYKNINYIWD